MPTQTEIRQDITTRIIAALKNGVAPPWRCPWRRNGPSFPTNVTGRKYSGTNVLLLQIAALDHGYDSNLWGTYRSWQAKDGQVRKGEKSTKIIFTKTLRKEVIDPVSDKTRIETIPLLRTYSVFNLSQCSGDALDRFRPHEPEEETISIGVDWEPAQRLIDGTGADIRYASSDDRAFYSFDGDLIQIPMRHRFTDLSAFFDVHWHELTHWSGVYSGEGKMRRMEWDGSYALAELIAEMTTCFVAANLGLPNCDDLENHNRYLASWLKEMEDDPKWIIRASSMASKVCDFLLSFVPSEVEVPQPAMIV